MTTVMNTTECCPSCSGSGFCDEREHPDCPHCSDYLDCQNCKGSGVVVVTITETKEVEE